VPKHPTHDLPPSAIGAILGAARRSLLRQHPRASSARAGLRLPTSTIRDWLGCRTAAQWWHDWGDLYAVFAPLRPAK